MADKKISELTALTGADTATDDQLVIVDTSAGLTKSITVAEFQNALDGSTGFVRITGDTMTGNLNMGDNVKAVFGAGSDLQIYHDGSNSYVKDAGTGDLFLQGSSNVQIESAAGVNMIYATAGAQVRLFYNGSPKFNTTSTGVDITGTITSDGLTVESGSNALSSTGNNIQFNRASGSSFIDQIGASGSLLFRTTASQTSRLKIDNNGDISFYEDTGTTAKFFWDASAERLAVGGTATNATLHVHGNSVISNGNFFSIQSSSGLSPELDEASNGWAFTTNGAERMRIDSSGDVGIGTTSPAFNTGSGIEVQRAGEATLRLQDTTNTANGEVRSGDAGLTFYAGAYGTSGSPFIWNAGGSERMRIDSSGNVMVGGTVAGNAGTVSLNVGNVGSTIGGLQLWSTTTGTHYVQFGDESGTAANHYRGYMAYAHNGDSLRFGTASAERMRIDSSGNLLVGKTSTNYNADGFQAFAAGFVHMTADISSGSQVLTINRKTSDGDIAVFRKDGAAVGSIGVAQSGDRTYFAGGSYGIASDTSEATIMPCGTTGTGNDGVLNLGKADARFKDLYVSGGVYLGGTGSDNHLDDYEEGDYDVAITCGTSGTITLSTSYNRASYVKVGSLVHVQGLLITSAVSSPTGFFEISLPFTVANLTDRSGDSSGSILVHGSSANVRDFVCMINEGLDKLLVYLGDATTRQEDSANAITANVQINFQCSYRTT